MRVAAQAHRMQKPANSNAARESPSVRRGRVGKASPTLSFVTISVTGWGTYQGLKYGTLAGSLPHTAARYLSASFDMVPSSMIDLMILSIVALLAPPFG